MLSHLATSKNIAPRAFSVEFFRNIAKQFWLSSNVLQSGQTVKHILLSKSQMFDQQFLILWPGLDNKMSVQQFYSITITHAITASQVFLFGMLIHRRCSVGAVSWTPFRENTILYHRSNIS